MGGWLIIILIRGQKKGKAWKVNVLIGDPFLIKTIQKGIGILFKSNFGQLK